MLKCLLAAALFAAPAAAAAPAQPGSYAGAIEVCRTAFVERITGREPVKANAALAELDENSRLMTELICAGYEQGQRDLLGLIEGDADGGGKPI